jgi:hypothetical protein
MLIETIIGTVILIIVIILVKTFFKSLLTVLIIKVFVRIISIIILGSIILSIMFGAFIIKDATSFKQKFYNSSNAFVLSGSGAHILGVEISKEMTSVNPINNEKMQKLAPKNGVIRVPSEYYKMIIIDIDTITRIDKYYFEDINLTLNSTEMKELLNSSDTRSRLINIITSKLEDTPEKDKVLLYIGAQSDEEIRTRLFSVVLTTIFNKDSSYTLLKLIKEQKITVQPETMIFNNLKYVPDLIMKHILIQ